MSSVTFTAAITLLLGLIGPSHTTTNPIVVRERTENMQLVETVVQILEGLKGCGTGVEVVNQSISVIRSLKAFFEAITTHLTIYASQSQTSAPFLLQAAGPCNRLRANLARIHAQR